MIRLIFSLLLIFLWWSSPSYAQSMNESLRITSEIIKLVRPTVSKDTILILDKEVSFNDVKKNFPSYSISNLNKSPGIAFVSSTEQARMLEKAVTVGPLSCVDDNACMFSIEVKEKKIKVYYSPVAAAIAGYDIDPHFRLLVTTR